MYKPSIYMAGLSVTIITAIATLAIFNSYVYLPEGKTTIFLWFSYDFPIKPPFSYGFPMIYQRVTTGWWTIPVATLLPRLAAFSASNFLSSTWLVFQPRKNVDVMGFIANLPSGELT